MIASTQWIMDLADTDRADLLRVGGKGANLGAMIQAGFTVPPGFCLTTDTYRHFVNSAQDVIAQQIATLDPDDGRTLDTAAQMIRTRLEALPIPDEIVAGIKEAYARLVAQSRAAGLAAHDGDDLPVAVRSSATAEDLPDASFAGQQDTLLNIRSLDALLVAVKRCWSSLWTARAIAYRQHHGFAHEQVALAVIVQVMIDAEVAGVLFTADPVDGYRTRMVVNGAWGLGEAIVSGIVAPDTWHLDRAGTIISAQIGRKEVLVRYAAAGGTITEPTPPDRQTMPCLGPSQLQQLAALGRNAERYFGEPQDLEWALAGGTIWLLQSRPITTLFPLPTPRPTDDDLHVYGSVNNVQGMLEPITPMGCAVFKEIGRTAQAYLGIPVFPPGKAGALVIAADRLFADLTPLIRSPRGRRIMLGALALMDPQSGQALRNVLDDPRLRPQPLMTRAETVAFLRPLRPVLWGAAKRIIRNVWAPERAVWRIAYEFQPRLTAILARAEQARTLSERLLMIRVLFRGALPLMGQYVPPAFVPGLLAGAIIERLVRRWGLPADKLPQLRQGLPHNPTTEMDLLLWDISRAIAADPASRKLFMQADAAAIVQQYRQHALPTIAQERLHDFLERYGHRSVREIDIGVPRWAENPTYIINLVRSYLLLDDPAHAPDRHFAQLQQHAAEVAAEIVAAARRQRGGWFKAWLIRFLIRRLRTLAGLREGPKFWAIRIFRTIRVLLRGCGDILVQRGLLDATDDVFFLTLDELLAIDHGSTEPLRPRVAARRRSYTQELQRHQVPRIVTSEGRVVYGRALTDDPHTLTGVGVSPGVVEGPARIVRDPHGAQLRAGDILVAPSTDPAWTPLFLTAGGLVMEAGGMLSHGSVVAREYGIPAVVAVANATTILRDGQPIRVDGTSGTIELLDQQPTTIDEATLDVSVEDALA